MRADIILVDGGQEYLYGNYAFETKEEQDRVNELAVRIAEERGVQTYVLRHS